MNPCVVWLGNATRNMANECPLTANVNSSIYNMANKFSSQWADYDNSCMHLGNKLIYSIYQYTAAINPNLIPYAPIISNVTISLQVNVIQCSPSYFTSINSEIRGWAGGCILMFFMIGWELFCCGVFGV